MKPVKIVGIELSTPGDIATAGLAYAIGFGIDAFFFSHGVSSGAAAGACAAGAIGAKYTIQGFLQKKQVKPE
ncbi:MAG: hypothetical protein KZQ83_07020 [gamma proteobacterium symbiont of Taylorina sp.]|nr:hypothetical protein [gamma proteobacterium symbiont of Taylorina sp.]